MDADLTDHLGTSAGRRHRAESATSTTGQREDGAHRARLRSDRAAARPGRLLRAADRAQTPAPLRRADHRHVRPRDECPRHPGAPARTPPRRGRPRPDLESPTLSWEDVHEWQSRPLEDVSVSLALEVDADPNGRSRPRCERGRRLGPSRSARPGRGSGCIGFQASEGAKWLFV